MTCITAGISASTYPPLTRYPDAVMTHSLYPANWIDFYNRAMQERDPRLVGHSVEAARLAIHARTVQLARELHVNEVERELLEIALQNLLLHEEQVKRRMPDDR